MNRLWEGRGGVSTQDEVRTERAPLCGDDMLSSLRVLRPDLCTKYEWAAERIARLLVLVQEGKILRLYSPCAVTQNRQVRYELDTPFTHPNGRRDGRAEGAVSLGLGMSNAGFAMSWVPLPARQLRT